MPDMTAPLKLGADIWNLYTEWPAFVAAFELAEQLGYDSLWTPDHLLTPLDRADGPILEPYMAIAPVAAATTHATVGLFVGGNTYRNPALVAKMVTTLDHISGGRAVLGIGAGWSEVEHTQYGFEFGASPGERLRWLREALPVIRGMLDGTRPSAAGDHYAMREVDNQPPPVQSHLPIMIGGSGRKVTLRLVAEFADINNVSGSPDKVRDIDQVLIDHCVAVGRNEREIERSIAMGVPVIRDTHEAAVRDHALLYEANRTSIGKHDPIGTVDEVVDRCLPYVQLGYRHLIFYYPAPYDVETMTRMTTEVRPRLEAAVDAAPA